MLILLLFTIVYPKPYRTLIWSIFKLLLENTIIPLGNGAEFLLSPNFNLPLIKHIALALGNIISYHSLVSVLAGIKHTIVLLYFILSLQALVIQSIWDRP